MRLGAKQPLILPLTDITLNAAAFWNNALIHADTVSTYAIRKKLCKSFQDSFTILFCILDNIWEAVFRTAIKENNFSDVQVYNTWLASSTLDYLLISWTVITFFKTT